jgi:hypothetical protein
MANDQEFYLGLKSIGMSRCGGKKASSLLDAARHNRREIQAEFGASAHIDPTRTSLNEVLLGPDSAGEILALSRECIEAAGLGSTRLKRDHVQALELVFSLPNEDSVPSARDYFKQCLKWTQRALPELKILSFDIHRDESAPHAHCLLSPFSNGRSLAKEVKTRARLKALNEAFFQQVAGPAGLRRARPKMQGKTKEWATETVLSRLAEIRAQEIDGCLWPLTVGAIKANPLPYLEILGIDASTIRPPKPKAIALESAERAIALHAENSRDDVADQGLSCVALHKPDSLSIDVSQHRMH